MAFDHDDVKIIKEETVYQGFFTMKKYRLQHQQFAGGMSREIDREILYRGTSVAVLLYDKDADKVVLIEQFRVGALEDPKTPWLLEIVAGMSEANELPEEVAIRETREEVGYSVGELIPICDFYPSPGGTSELCKIYLALIDSNEIDLSHESPEHDEDIRVHLLNRTVAYEKLATGAINNSAAIIALQWLELNLTSLH